MSYRTTAIETDKMPPGIPYIIGNEAAERFSFYGMRAILSIFLANYLMYMDAVPGGALSKEKATEYYHIFTFAVYLTPLFGGLIADIFFGKYKTILWLSIVYCLGHLALACMGTAGKSEWWLMAGLALICIGAGGIKPCVSAHVGDQFGRKNHHLISKVYNWFYFSINFGSFFSTLLTPWLLEKHGPHWAFGVPGVLMAVATFMFWLGRHRFIHIPPAGSKFVDEVCSKEGLTALGKLIPLFAFITMFWALYDQTGSSWVFQAQQMDLNFMGFQWLESQVQAVNPILILTYIPLFTFIIYPALNRVFPLTPLRKIGMGMILMAASFGLATLIQTWIDAGQRPSVGWQILAFALITAAEIMVSIVGLEFAYTQAPKALKSMVMALFWLSVAMGNILTAQVNRFIAIPSGAQQQFEEATAKLPPDWQTEPRNILLPGYDQTPNTDDDIVARAKNGTLESIEIPGQEIYLEAAAVIEAHSNEKFPTVEEGLALLVGKSDRWGNPLTYSIVDASHVKVSSFGPPKSEKTPWEIGVVIEKEKAETVKEDSWLARRKRELGIDDAPVVAGFTRTQFCGGQSKLEGASYFRFFTWLILGTAVLFIPFALVYRPKSYLHD